MLLICPFDAFVIAFGDFASELFVVAVKYDLITDDAVRLSGRNPVFGEFGFGTTITVSGKFTNQSHVLVANLSGTGTGKGQDSQKCRKYNDMPPDFIKNWVTGYGDLIMACFVGRHDIILSKTIFKDKCNNKYLIKR